MAIIFRQNLGKYNAVMASRGKPIIVSNFVEDDYQLHTDWQGLQPVTFADIWEVNRNSTATYFDANGILRTAAPHEPRIHFDPSTGENLGLLVEGESTNSVRQSGDAHLGGFWIFSSGAFADHYIGSDALPTSWLYGVSTADRFPRSRQLNVIPDIPDIYTVSIFIKLLPEAVNTNDFRIGNALHPTTSLRWNARINPLTGQIISTNQLVDARVTPYPNSWLRYELVIDFNGSNLATGWDPDIFNTNNTGVRQEIAVFALLQVESGNKASSPIISNGSATTRLADIITLKGAE